MTFGEYGSGINEVMLNEAGARLLYRDRDPLGQYVRFAKRTNPCHTVVGVVENTNSRAVIEAMMGQFYVPLGSAAAEEWKG